MGAAAVATMTSPVVVTSSFLPGESPFVSAVYDVAGIECTLEMAYWAGLASVWGSGRTIVNVEHDMEFSDELVAGLLACPHPLCMYPYQVYPTKLQRFIYCATTENDQVDHEPRWVEGPSDEWAGWASIGFCKISPEAQSMPLARMFWWYLEHCVNRVATSDGTRWHLHWPGVDHHHDYEKIPDHLW